MCRISDLQHRSFDVEPIPAKQWETGDYVIGTISKRPSHKARVEAPNGREIEPLEGEQVLGALGNRAATREAVGYWRNIDQSTGHMDLLGGGGLIGRTTSTSPFLHPLISLTYDGHVHLNGRKRNMTDYTPDGPDELEENTNVPIILVLGTSMSSGKTMSCRVIIRALKQLGITPVGCKLTGAGRYHDVKTMEDAGADPVFDFVDAGLPSTVVPEQMYSEQIQPVISRIRAGSPDAIVAEIGASPLEPYNGDVAVRLIQDDVVCTVLSASDPYAVVGMQSTFDINIDLVSGIATNTEAGEKMIRKMTGLPAMNLLVEESLQPLTSLLKDKLPDERDEHD